MCDRDKYAADDFVVVVVDNAHDNPVDLANHFRLQCAAAYHGNTADNRRHDACPIAHTDESAHFDDSDNRQTADHTDHTDRRSVTVSEEQEASRTMPKWFGIVGLFVAPTTLITSLCYFYGYVATRTSLSSESTPMQSDSPPPTTS